MRNQIFFKSQDRDVSRYLAITSALVLLGSSGLFFGKATRAEEKRALLFSEFKLKPTLGKIENFLYRDLVTPYSNKDEGG